MKQFKRFMGIILTAGVIVSMTGCMIGQGYYFNKPMRAEEFESLSEKE